MLRLITTVDILASGETPSIMPEISPSDIGPGFPGFVATFSIVALVAILIVDMARRIRRVRYRSQVAERNSAAAEPESSEQMPDGQDGSAHVDSGKPRPQAPPAGAPAKDE